MAAPAYLQLQRHCSPRHPIAPLVGELFVIISAVTMLQLSRTDEPFRNVAFAASKAASTQFPS